MDKTINNIVEDTILEYFLDETYESVGEVRKLANDLVMKVAEQNIEQIQRHGKIQYIYGVYLKAIKPQEFNVLKNFIKYANLTIKINEKGPEDPKGDYSVYQDYDPNNYMDINVNLDNYKGVLDDINQRVEEKEHENFTTRDLYMNLFYKLYSTLVHELQHAYDDYRSSGKAYKTKEFTQYKEKYHQNKERTEVNQDFNKFKKYINLPHEIWARFSQAMYTTYFTSLEMDDTNHWFEMKPIKEVVKDFQRNFENYRLLPDKMKRKLVNKVVQFWHYEDEKLKQDNTTR